MTCEHPEQSSEKVHNFDSVRKYCYGFYYDRLRNSFAILISQPNTTQSKRSKNKRQTIKNPLSLDLNGPLLVFQNRASVTFYGFIEFILHYYSVIIILHNIVIWQYTAESSVQHYDKIELLFVTFSMVSIDEYSWEYVKECVRESLLNLLYK